MFGGKDHIQVVNGHLHISGADTVEIARRFGTPVYVTSEDRLRENIRRYHRAFPDAEKYFAVKANGNISIIRILAQEGAGADVFSAGELYLARLAGVPRERILFNGNSKRDDELRMAAAAGVRVSIDSEEELESLSRIASEEGKSVEVLFRVNPDISVKTHPKIATGLKSSKFGIPAHSVRSIYEKAMQMEGVRPIGLHCHIGSQILDVSPFSEAAARMMDLVGEIVGIGGDVRLLDLGGGLGIQYDPAAPPAPSPQDLANAILPVIAKRSEEIGVQMRLILEPGRSIVADTTILLTRVNVVKRAHVTFVGVDAGFNVLARPMLYDAYHHIVVANRADADISESYTVVGPICESGDVLARERRLPLVERGDILAFLDAGAYGFSMSSQYNGQPRPAEVLVHSGGVELIRKAEDISALLSCQVIPARLM
ncbi:MAG: diaminopimelate decarboxylase [Methanothrix sp.]|uniref:diaminopimelate decarboxylase n=1 Tax=Methanothrix sp. TaxID=90426 RepID=UPI0025F7EA8E|nr:diaminopimelate decarboxylase [Methanothrix sp.]MCQ8903917.1 diaminopimelate decarboxylase [Methanothrix sp.]